MFIWFQDQRVCNPFIWRNKNGTNETCIHFHLSIDNSHKEIRMPIIYGPFSRKLIVPRSFLLLLFFWLLFAFIFISPFVYDNMTKKKKKMRPNRNVKMYANLFWFVVFTIHTLFSWFLFSSSTICEKKWKCWRELAKKRHL